MSPDVVLADLLSRKAQAEQQIASLSSSRTPENQEVKQVFALLVKVDEQIKDRVEGILAGFQVQAKSAKTQREQLEEELDRIRKNEIAKNERFDPYFIAKRDLETKRKLRDAIAMKILQEKIDKSRPRRLPPEQ